MPLFNQIKHTDTQKRNGELLNSDLKRKILIRTIIMFLSVFLISCAIVFFVINVKKESKFAYLRSVESQEIDVQQGEIQEELVKISNDMLMIVQNEDVVQYWNDTASHSAKITIEKVFAEIITYRRLYDQARLIDENGIEKVRVNFNTGKTEIVAESDLQNKSNRYYFTEAWKLEKNQFYISPLDLNVENGKIETPFKPMIRISAPVFDKSGTKKGVVVLNYFGQRIIDKSSTHYNPTVNSDLMLLNDDGYWLKGTSADLEWGFMFDGKKNVIFQNLYKEEWSNIQSSFRGQFKTDNGLFTYKTIFPLPNISIIEKRKDNGLLGGVRYFPEHYSWKLVSHISPHSLYSEYHQHLVFGLSILFVLAVLLVIIAVRNYKNNCFKVYSRLQIENSHKRFKATLDSIDAIVYVSDFETNEILFANKYLTDLFGDVEGKLCYKTLQMGQDAPCEFCTNHLLISKKVNSEPYIWEFQNTITKRWYQCHDQSIQWTDGRSVRMEIAFDITGRKQAEAALKKSEMQLKKAQETASIGHWELEAESQTLIWSDEVYNIFGVEKGKFKVSLNSFVARIHPDERDHVLEEFQKSVMNNSEYNIIHRIVLDDGSIKYVNERCVHKYENGKHSFSLGTVSDVTKLVEKENQIKKQNNELIELNASKDKFFSIIAHDLRSPLGSVLQLIKTLSQNYESYDTAFVKELIDVLLKSSENTYGLLENLLEWSRLQTDTMKFRPVQINVNDLVNNAVVLYKDTALSKQIVLSSQIDLTYIIIADLNMVYTVLRNIISNAVKFTPKGGEIIVSTDKFLKNGKKYIAIHVKDNGNGMSQQKIDSLFIVDNNNSTAGTGGERGSGLGLILCKELVDKNNGEIVVESEQGKGSTFTVLLPEDETLECLL